MQTCKDNRHETPPGPASAAAAHVYQALVKEQHEMGDVLNKRKHKRKPGRITNIFDCSPSRRTASAGQSRSTRVLGNFLSADFPDHVILIDSHETTRNSILFS
jgi:hypothetical protein